MQTKNVAIAGIVILEAIALVKEIDGAFFMPIALIIAALAGYEIRLFKEKREHGT